MTNCSGQSTAQSQWRTEGVSEDQVNHPSHYQHQSGIEVIQITETMGFCLGNVVKYVLRCERKGNKLQDLKKARWYLDREIARLERQGSR